MQLVYTRSSQELCAACSNSVVDNSKSDMIIYIFFSWTHTADFWRGFWACRRLHSPSGLDRCFSPGLLEKEQWAPSHHRRTVPFWRQQTSTRVLYEAGSIFWINSLNCLWCCCSTRSCGSQTGPILRQVGDTAYKDSFQNSACYCWVTAP